MESQGSLRAWRRMKGRKPKTFDESRYCADTDCETKLSTYNRGPFCYSHSPVRFPRNRGVAIEA